MTMTMERSDVADRAPRHMALLGISERGGRDETPLVDGEIPRDLNGSLYRNGPGLFERGALRKPHLLDGDGLVQRLSFADGKVRYQNAFVRTAKFVEEEADAFRSSTWSKRRPGACSPILAAGTRARRPASRSTRSTTSSMRSTRLARPTASIR